MRRQLWGRKIAFPLRIYIKSNFSIGDFFSVWVWGLLLAPWGFCSLLGASAVFVSFSCTRELLLYSRASLVFASVGAPPPRRSTPAASSSSLFVRSECPAFIVVWPAFLHRGYLMAVRCWTLAAATIHSGWHSGRLSQSIEISENGSQLSYGPVGTPLGLFRTTRIQP